MANTVDLIRNLAFEVEAIPHDNVTKFKSTGTPLNVKIRVRKKEKGSSVPQGFIAVSKNGRPEEALERIRLASSDQTIMSFNMLMESELEKVRNKKRKTFLGVCFGSPIDDDDSPYLPAQDTSNMSRSETEIIKNKLKLTKPDPAYDNKENNLFGKCKPGGCLDPPFGEERYKYMPTKEVDLSDSLQKTVIIKQSSEKIKQEDESKKKKLKNKIDDKEVKENTILNLYPSKNKIIALEDSESIITYPPEENDWQDQDKTLTHRRQSSASSNRSRRSFQSEPTYYTPKKRDSIKDEITDITSPDRNLEEKNKNISKYEPLSDKNKSQSNDALLADKEKLSYGRPLKDKEKISDGRPLSDKETYDDTAVASGIAAAVSGGAAAAAAAFASTRDKDKKEKSTKETSDDPLQKPQASKDLLRSKDTDTTGDLNDKKRLGSNEEENFIDSSDSSKVIPVYDKRSSTILKKSQFSLKDKTDIWDEEERRLSRTKNITIIDDNKEPKPVTTRDNLPDQNVSTEPGNDFLQGIEHKQSADKPINIREDKLLGIDAMKEHRFSYSGSRDFVIDDSASTSNITPLPISPRDLDADKTSDSNGQITKRKGSRIGTDEDKKTDKNLKHQSLDSKGGYVDSSSQGKIKGSDLETDKGREKGAIDSQNLDGKGSYVDSSRQGAKIKESYLEKDKDRENHARGSQNLDGKGSYVDSSRQGAKRKESNLETDKDRENDAVGYQRLDGKGSYVDSSSQGTKRKESNLETDKDRENDAIGSQRLDGKESYVDSSGQGTKRKGSYLETNKDRGKGAIGYQNLDEKGRFIDSSGQGTKRKGSYLETDKDRKNDTIGYQSLEGKQSYEDLSGQGTKRKGTDKDREKYSTNSQSLGEKGYVDTSRYKEGIPTNFDEDNNDRSSLSRSPITGVHIPPDNTKIKTSGSELSVVQGGLTEKQINPLDSRSLTKTASVLRLHVDVRKTGKSVKENTNLEVIEQGGSTELTSTSHSGKENASILKRISKSSSIISPKLSPTSSVILNLALKRTSNDREVFVRSLDWDANNVGEDGLILVNAKLKPHKEIRIRINEESDMTIQLKKPTNSDTYHSKSFNNIDVNFKTETAEKHWAGITRGKQDVNFPGVSFSDRMVKLTSNNDIHQVLSSIYVQDLMPVKNVIKSLKEEVDMLAGQLTYLKKPKLAHSTRACACLKKKYEY